MKANNKGFSVLQNDFCSEDKKSKAALYLIPVTLGETSIEQVLPAYNHDIIVGIKHFIVENIRSARRFLKKVEKSIDIDELTFYELNRHTDRKFIGEYLEAIKQGKDVGIISEAGCPAIADPGADVVAIAQQRGIKVVPLVGPSSIIMSVMGSGFNGQSFAFNGYLPVEVPQRIKALKKLETKVWNDDQTQLFIETPYRNGKMFETIVNNLKPNTYGNIIPTGKNTEKSRFSAKLVHRRRGRRILT